MAKKADTAVDRPIATDEPAVDSVELIPADPVVEIVRRLRINRQYIGYRSNERAIIPGLYYEDDPFLFGLADYLVANQYAEWYG